MATPTVDLRRVSVLQEIVVRAGNTGAPDARKVLKDKYEGDRVYPDVVGLSTIFREGASLDELARAAHFPHPKISWSVVGRLIAELGADGYEPVLFVIPTAVLADHHTLAVARGGVVEQSLSDAAANALIRAMRVEDNPYKAQP
jgi:hypothetical protein